MGMYRNSSLNTLPGTEMNVTPEIEAPTIPYATTGHGAFLSAVKNELLLPFPPVTLERIRSMTA